MNKNRKLKILEEMRKNKIEQLIISDKFSIFYLTGKKIESGERLLVLYLNIDGTSKLVINKLFTQVKDLNLDFVWYDDEEDAVEILGKIINPQSTLGVDKNWPSGFLIRLNELVGNLKVINSSFIIDNVRLIKDDEEQKFMRESSKINDIAMEKIIPFIKTGVSEKELNLKIREIYKELGCEDVAFEPVIAFGKNAANPHHESDETICKNGDCVVIDIGGIKNNYASDMTRTIFVGEVSNFAREIYEIVREANQIGIKTAKVGVRMCDVDSAVRNYIESKGYGEYFIHRTGHSIGLEDHEAGDVSVKNNEIIKEGQCFSIEPGIYIPEKEIGIRIEDLVIITKDGAEVLNSYTKDLIII